MAGMSASQTTAELQRKKNLGYMPDSAANMAQYKTLTKTTPMPATPKATGGVVPPLANPNLNPYTNGPNAVFGAGGAASAIPKVATPSAGGVIPPLTGPSPVNGTQGIAANSTTKGVIPQFTPNPLAPSLNQQQIEYINKKFGSLDNYVNKQDSRYNDALVTGNNGLLDALSKDSTRLGYTLHDQFREQAEEKAAKEYEDAKIKADAQKEALQNNFNYGRQNINDSRVLQDSQFNRSVNPFSGRKGYLQAQTERGRSIDDTMANSALQSQLNEIDSGLGNIDQNEMADELYNSLLSSARGQAIDTAKLTGKFGGVDTLEADNQHYNQKADQRDFEYTSGRDKVKDAQFEAEFNQRVKNDGIQNAISWANNALSAQDNALAREKFNYDKTKDANKPVEYNYEKDPDYADAVQGVLNDSDALTTLKLNAAALISKFGQKAYDSLLQYATPKKTTTNDLFSQLFAQ